MTRPCSTVRAGVHCGRTAKVRAGLAVEGHQPGETRLLCVGCQHDWEWQLADVLATEGVTLSVELLE